MLNHNLIEKISQKYIEERVEERVKERKKMYFYLYQNNTSYDISYHCLDYKFIEADNDRECCSKVFDELESIHGDFMEEYSGDKVIRKYRFGSEYKNIISKGEIDEIEFDRQFIRSFSNKFDDNDIKHINDLKYNYINGLIRKHGVFKNVTYRVPGRLLIIVKYPGHML